MKETLCNFEVSELLKEKGFDYDIHQPTHSAVSQWLKGKFGIWILVLPQPQTAVDYRTNGFEFPHHAFFYSVIRYDRDGNCTEVVNTSDNNSEWFLHFETEEDSYNHSIKWILTNLL